MMKILMLSDGWSEEKLAAAVGGNLVAIDTCDGDGDGGGVLAAMNEGSRISQQYGSSC